MANNPYVNKVVYGDQTLIDISDTTAVASDVAQGKYFYLPSGEKVAGTSTGGGGGGSVTQDQDGFIVLPPDGGSSPSGGGLEYEEGTWIPSADVADAWIPFANTHSTTPFFYAVWDATGTHDGTTYSDYAVTFFSGELAFGEPLYASTTSKNYARTSTVYRGSNSSVISGSAYGATSSDVDSGSSSYGYSRYWANNTGIHATSTMSDRYWRTGRTYKWIAVWAPTT